MKTRKFYRLAPLLLVTLLSAASCMPVLAGKPSLTADSRARKADYIFLEAERQRSINNDDAYFELISAAYGCNPDDKYLAYADGLRRAVLLGQEDTTKAFRDSVISMLRDYVVSAPTDISAGRMLASVAMAMGYADEAGRAMERLYESNGQRTDLGMEYINALLATSDPSGGVKAETILDTLEQRDGISPELSMLRMRLYEARRDTAAIKAEVQKLLRSNPAEEAYISFAGRLYYELGDPDSALIYFNRAVELDPTSGTAYFNRASFYNQTGDSAAYDREVFQAMQLPDLDIEPKLEILRAYVSKLYQDSTQTGRILTLFRSLTDQYPHEPRVRNLYADYLMAIRDFAGAAEQKSYELDVDPSEPQNWITLSSLYMLDNDYVKSRHAAQRGMRYFPDNIDLYELSANADVQKGDYQAALATLDKAIALSDTADAETLSKLYSQVGDVYYRMEKMDSVSHYYDKSVKLNPFNTLALNNYAYYLSCTEGADLDRALSMIESVMATKNDDPTSLDTYAWVLFKRKDYAKAREIIDLALNYSEEDSAELLEHAGDIYFMDGQPDKAVQFWSRALKYNSENELLRRKVRQKTFFYK